MVVGRTRSGPAGTLSIVSRAPWISYRPLFVTRKPAGASVRPLLLVLSLLAAVAYDASAQIIRGRPRVQQPSAWVSGGIALQQPWSVRDGTTGSDWEFGDARQYVASLEKEITGGASVGLRGTTSRVPLLYRVGSVGTDADATVSQGFAVLHVASGGAFHSVFELSAGATRYSDFRTRVNDAPIGAVKPDIDFTFGFGYGVGFSLSPRFAIEAVQDISTVMHQKTGLGAGESTSTRMHSTRIVARLGLGGR